jgi:hypothetical protein
MHPCVRPYQFSEYSIVMYFQFLSILIKRNERLTNIEKGKLELSLCKPCLPLGCRGIAVLILNLALEGLEGSVSLLGRFGLVKNPPAVF